MNHTELASLPTDPAVAAGARPDPLLTALLRAAHVLEQRLEEALRGVGLSRAKYEALDQLARAGGSLSLKALAEGQRCAPSNVTQLVDRLEADGLVRRTDDAADRRSRRAELTTLGACRAADGTAAIAAVHDRFADALPADGRAALAGALDRIR